MVDSDLVEYIGASLRRGLSMDEIKGNLFSRGYGDYDIQKALESTRKKAILKDVEISKRVYSDTADRIKKILFAALILLVIISISIVVSSGFGKFGERYFEVKSPVIEGKYLSLSKNNVIEIDYQGEKSEITIVVKGRTYFFTGFGANIILESGGEETVDFNLDGKPDFSFSNEGADGDNILYLKEICQEDWSCESWGDCVNGTRERKCFDLNECFSIVGMPDIIEVC